MKLSALLSKFCIAPLPIPTECYAIPLRLIVGFGFIEHVSTQSCPRLGELRRHSSCDWHAFRRSTCVDDDCHRDSGGLPILLGAFIPFAAIPMTIVLLVAIVTVHFPIGFSSIKLQSYDATGAHFGPPGYETDLLYLAALVALCIAGAGPLSLDRKLAVCSENDVRAESDPVAAHHYLVRSSFADMLLSVVRKTWRFRSEINNEAQTDQRDADYWVPRRNQAGYHKHRKSDQRADTRWLSARAAQLCPR